MNAGQINRAYLGALEHFRERIQVDAKREGSIAAVFLEAISGELDSHKSYVRVIHSLEVLRWKVVRFTCRRDGRAEMERVSMRHGHVQKRVTRRRRVMASYKTFIILATHDALLIALEVRVCHELFDS
jgi:hypothetical protein